MRTANIGAGKMDERGGPRSAFLIAVLLFGVSHSLVGSDCMSRNGLR